MRKLVKLGMFTFLSVALATSFIGCSDDDPDYSNVTPPTVSVSHSISGRVTGMDGNGLSATVSMNGTSAQTDADGMFVFEDVAAGSYTLTATAPGKQTKETTVTVTESGSSANVVWNVALPNEGATIEIAANGDTEAAVTSETIEGNDEGAVTVEVTVPETAELPAGSSVVITPLYTLDEAEANTRATTRATENVMLIGTNVACTDANATLASPIQLTYDVDAEVAQSITAQKYVNGQWVDAEYTVEGDQVVVFADQFTSYTLLFGAEVTSSTTTTPLAFEQDLWDNLYGSGDMTAGSASFTYHIGTEITSSGTSRITAYLIEILARIAGASITTATGTYPLNVTLPIGTALHVTGTQQVTTLTVSALNRSVSGRQYGDIAVVTTSYNRNHNGGTNL
mgnify:CR=1 FL=1